MRLFSKFHHTPERFAESEPGSPSSATTELTDLSESPSHSRHDSNSPQPESSGPSVTLQFLTNSSESSSYSSRKNEKGWIHDINKHNLMAKHLYRNCKKNNWLENRSNEAVVALRTFQGGYIIFPPEDRDEKYESAIKRLDVEV